MLQPEATAAHGVSLVFGFLIANTKRELVDEVERAAKLLVGYVVRGHLLGIVFPDVPDESF